MVMALGRGLEGQPTDGDHAPRIPLHGNQVGQGRKEFRIKTGGEQSSMAKSGRVPKGQGQVPDAAQGSAGRAPKKAPLEKSVVTRILNWLRDQPECYAIKTQGTASQSGWPDIIGSWQGRFFAFEVKRPGNNRVTELQLATLNKWRSAGGVVGVVHSLEEVRELLKEA